jgi:hypothetical protein
MQCIGGRMRTAIQKHRSIDGAKPLGVKRDDLARDGIDFLRDSQR